MKRLLIAASLLAALGCGSAFAGDDDDYYATRNGETYADRLERMFPTTGVQPLQPVSPPMLIQPAPIAPPPQPTVILPMNGGGPSYIILPMR